MDNSSLTLFLFSNEGEMDNSSLTLFLFVFLFFRFRRSR